jgi:4-amino-4-deoxy-L-arabinose transferase-like glycosyltransferase
MTRQRTLLLAIAVAFVGVAFGIRLDGISTPPFDNAVARQFRSAVLARAYFLGDGGDRPASDRALVAAWRDEDQAIEPPIMELLAAGAYHVGGEHLSIPRAISVFWWIVGGVLLFLVAESLLAAPAALATAAVYLFLPFGVLVSRSFQPDPLLVATTVAALLMFLRYDARPSRGRLVAAVSTAALAMFVKPGVAAPFLFILAAALSLRRVGPPATTRSPLLIGLVAATIPMFAWYAYGTFDHSYLRGHFGAKVEPSLLVRSSFWHGWWDQVVFALTYPVKSGLLAVVVLAGCLAGVLVAQARTRVVLLALWIGYAVYGLIFTVHISTHNYYSLMLVPIVALSLGSLVDGLLRRMHVPAWRATVVVGVVGVVAAAAVSWKLHYSFTDPGFRADAARYSQIGSVAAHTARALYVDTHYAEPARYYGWTAGRLLTSGYESHPQQLADRLLERTLSDRPPPSCLIFVGAGLASSLSKFEQTVAHRFAPLRRMRDYAIFDLSRSAAQKPDGCA